MLVIQHHGRHHRDQHRGNQLGEEEFKLELRLMEEVTSAIEVHRLPPKLPDKFCTIIHSLALETDGPHALADLCEQVLTTTTDMGVEFAISQVEPVQVDQVLPWICMRPLAGGGGDPCGFPAEDWDVEPAEWPRAGLNKPLPIAGLLHIISNVASGLLNMSSLIEDTIDKLAAVASMIRNCSTCDRLCERCFSDRVGQAFQPTLRRFSAKVHRKRWGTVAWCISEMLALESILRYGWNRDLYQGGPDSGVPANGFSVNIDLVDEALTDLGWWAALLMLDKLHEVVRETMTWAESCPCHGGLGPELATAEQRAAWQSCPFRGLRNPELSAGDFFVLLEELVQHHGAALLLELPTELSGERRIAIVHNFEQCRSWIIFSFTLKLTPMMEPPLLICGAAHFDNSKARRCVQRCLQSLVRHPLIDRLKSGQVRFEAIAFVDGASREELPALLALMGKLRFGSSVERMVEGERSHLHRYVHRAPRHAMPYDSLSRRMPEIKSLLNSGSVDSFNELAIFCTKPAIPGCAYAR